MATNLNWFLVASVILACFFRLCKSITSKGGGKPKKKLAEAPQPKGGWPILGHLPLLAGPTQPWRTLAAMADKNGPVFTLRLGSAGAVVVSGKEGIKECFTTNDNNFLSRPELASLKYLGYNGATFALGPHGPFWLKMRKIIVLDILSDRRLSYLKCMRETEVNLGVKYLYSECKSSTSTTISQTMVDMSQWFGQVTTNMMLRMVAGKRYDISIDSSKKRDPEYEHFQSAFQNLGLLTAGFDFLSMVPGMRWLDLQGRVRSMKQTAKELDYFMSTWLEEHMREGQNGQLHEEIFDFIHVMLSRFADMDSIEGYDKKTVIKATSQILILAGAETSFLTMIWALSLLLNHNEKLVRVQDELRAQVGTDRWVEELDIGKLPYLVATVKETMRLYPSGPLAIPREAMSDCLVSGYHIPKGTILVANLWKLHRDPSTWADPNEFQPERFLTSHAKVDGRGQFFEYLPFSAGKRMCPGVISSLQIVHLTLARLLQGFDFAVDTSAKVDMNEGMGVALLKATPLKVRINPRLPSKLYHE